MDGCILADTGINFYSIIGIAFAVLVLSGGLLARRVKATARGVISIVTIGVLVFGAVPHRAFADAVCDNGSGLSGPGVTPDSPEASLASLLLRYGEVHFSPSPVNGEQKGVTLLDTNVVMWQLITSSDGTKLAGIDNMGYIYTSSNSGASWIMRTLISGVNDKNSIVDIAGSADGSKLVLTTSGGYIYTSADSGGTWTERSAPGPQNWSYVVSSSDGSRLAAIADDTVYVSSDSGVTWTPYVISAGMSSWASFAGSSDGSKLIVAPAYGYVYASSDGGMSWSQQVSSGENAWYSVASSSDGSRLVASTPNDVYVSLDSGVNWTQQASLSGRGDWYNVAVSADGSAFVAASNYIYTSSDSGSNWTQQMASGNHSRSALAFSADGSHIVSIADSSAYISADSGVTWTTHQPITVPDSYTIDIDPATAGLQRTVDMTATEGWSAVYDPATKYFEVTVTNDSVFDATTMRAHYSAYVNGQAQPLFAPIIFYQDAEIG